MMTVTALIVEDDPLDLKVLTRSLTRCAPGIRLATARDGEEALSALAAGIVPDVIVTDIQMPRMTGKELIEQVRRSAGFDSIPIVVLSTSDEDCDIQDCLRLGANAYVPKPDTQFGYTALAEELRDVLADEHESAIRDVSKFANGEAIRRSQLVFEAAMR